MFSIFILNLIVGETQSMDAISNQTLAVYSRFFKKRICLIYCSNRSIFLIIQAEVEDVLRSCRLLKSVVLLKSSNTTV